MNPDPVLRSPLDIGGGIVSFIDRGMGHLLFDVVPYAMGGNVSGEY